MCQGHRERDKCLKLRMTINLPQGACEGWENCPLLQEGSRGVCFRRSPQVPAAWGATCLWSQGTGSDLSLPKGWGINCRQKLIRVKEARLLETKGDCLDAGCIFAGSFFLFFHFVLSFVFRLICLNIPFFVFPLPCLNMGRGGRE